jgi:hypothetical protein
MSQNPHSTSSDFKPTSAVVMIVITSLGLLIAITLLCILHTGQASYTRTREMPTSNLKKNVEILYT